MITPQYVADLMSWGAIGARTTESQVAPRAGTPVSPARWALKTVPTAPSRWLSTPINAAGRAALLPVGNQVGSLRHREHQR